MNGSSEHTRVNRILLGPLERPALQWLSAHMPEWASPDLLTGIGFFGSVLVFAGYVLTNVDPRFMWLASFGFVVNWFGDSLDGTLARYRHIERPRYGFYIDHVIDSVTEALIFIGLGLSIYVNFDLALIALVGYLMLSIYVYITTYVSNEFRISYILLGPTEMRVIAIISNTIMLFAGNPRVKLPFIGEHTLYDVIIMFIIALFYIGFIVIALLKAHQLSEEDIKVLRTKKSKEKKVASSSKQE